MSSIEERFSMSPGKLTKETKWCNKGEGASRTCQNKHSSSSLWLSHDRLVGNPFGQSSLFQSSMVVCFVCGKFARDENTQKLFSKKSRCDLDTPFFPFLEYHDPAPGSEPMKDDWSVVACTVCSVLLSQQWKSFERARMPINKRLYWLKRPSGCEIRQPVSQIELEEILNEHSKENFGDRDAETDSDETCEDQTSPVKRRRSLSPQAKDKQDDNGEVKRNCSVVSDKSSPITTLFVCYSCGKKDSIPSSVFPVHCKPSYEQMRAGVPYYPTVLSERGAPNSTVLYDSITFLCKGCLPKYQIEWHFLQQTFLKKDITKMALPRIPLPEIVSCYLCGTSVCSKLNDGILYTLSSSGKKNAIYRWLSKHKQLNGSASLSFGFTYLCPNCRAQVISECKSEPDPSGSTSECETDCVEK